MNEIDSHLIFKYSAPPMKIILINKFWDITMFKKSALSLAIVLATSQLTGCFSSDDDDTPVVQNVAPTDIQVSSASVDENAMGATIGDLSATDADTNDTFTYATGDTRFVISGNSLSLAEGVSFDYEKSSATTVEVTVTDSASNTFTKELAVAINDTQIKLADLQNVYATGDSVSYSGQVARHLLILELTNYIGSGLQSDLDAEMFTSRQQVLDKLMSLYKTTDEAYDLELGERALTVSTIVDAKQSILKDISSSKKDLSGKIAGNDEKGQHKDWSTEFVAYGDKGSMSPEALIEHFLGKVADNAEKFLMGEIRTDNFDNEITKVYLGQDGQDYKQLVQKVLLGAVAFSQGADDYLDDDIAEKGLNADHVNLVDGKSYTNLEHQYDEGFGYFGAARDYLVYTDDEIAKKGGREEFQGMHDSDGDAELDFKSEFNFGHSQNAAKRDRGTADNTNPTDLTKEAMTAFIAGRQLLSDTANIGANLDEAQMLELKGFRDTALLAWEKSIAATAIHYINDTNGDLDTFGTDDFSYANLAKHWSELKGFVISLQFSRFSPLTDEQQAEVNTLIGDAPALAADDIEAYQAKLIQAREILGTAYGFDTENVEKW